MTDWMKEYSSIYADADRERTPEQIWIAIMAHASTIGEAIRTFKVESLSISAAHTFCWLCSFINKCNELKSDVFSINETLSGVVTLKYPSRCGHCKKLPCQCDAVEMDAQTDKAANYKTLFQYRQPHLLSYATWGIDEFLGMFNEIYAGRLHIQTLENIGFHFLEEVGEAAVAVRQLSQFNKITEHGIKGLDENFLNGLTTVDGLVENYEKYHNVEIKLSSRDPEILKARLVMAKMALVVEIGDTFSWFCGILNKMLSIEKAIWEKPEEHVACKFTGLEIALNKEYFNGQGKAICPTCKSKPCSCTFFNVSPKMGNPH